MPNIFISYRREDTGGYAGRLYDRLATHFGAEHIFMDVDTLEPGEDLVQAIQDKVASCDALVAVIGNRWLTSTDEAGHRRLDDEHDFVRLEIAAALDRKIRVVPALVDGARMPRPQDLPEPLAPLVRRNALEVSNTLFSQSVDVLIKTLDKLMQPLQSVQPTPPQGTVEQSPAQLVERTQPPAVTRGPAERREIKAAEAVQHKWLLILGVTTCWAVAYMAIAYSGIPSAGSFEQRLRLIPDRSGFNYLYLRQLARLFLGGALLMGLGALPGIKRIRADREVRLSVGGIVAGVIMLDLCGILLKDATFWLFLYRPYWTFSLVIGGLHALAGAVAGIAFVTLFRRELGLFSWKIVFINSLLWALGNLIGVGLDVNALPAYGFFIGAANGWTIFWTVSKKSERRL
jgi:hypothetical protein